MIKKSAGIICYREVSGVLEVLLAHPGGPYWARKDKGSWSIPKGEFEESEEPRMAALREFTEETGITLPKELISHMFELDPVLQPSGKMVYAWAVLYSIDPTKLKSNTFSMEWPPKSGNYKDFPEVDRFMYFPRESAKEMVLKGQVSFILQLESHLGY